MFLQKKFLTQSFLCSQKLFRPEKDINLAQLLSLTKLFLEDNIFKALQVSLKKYNSKPTFFT